MPDKDVQAWEYAVRVTNSRYALDAFGQLYRDRAITSRALLLASVGRAVKHAGQTTLYLTPMHAAKDKLLALIANTRAALSHVMAVAEQLPQTDRRKTFLDYVVPKITRPLPPWHPPDRIELAG